MKFSTEEVLKQKRKNKECHKCSSKNTKLKKEWFYGHRNGVYVGAYQESYYACNKHETYFTN